MHTFKFTSRHISLLAFLGLISLLSLIPLAHARAAPSSVVCSSAELIAAINDANASQTPSTIELPANCIVSLTTVDNDSGNGANGLPVITGDITVLGNGGVIERSAAASPEFRIIEIAPNGVLHLNQLTLRNGHTNFSESNHVAHPGGAIFNAGLLELDGTSITDNRTSDGRGDLTYGYDAGNGGGIFSLGTLHLNHSVILNNRTGKGIHFGTPGYSMSRSGSGGGIYATGSVTLDDTLVLNNLIPERGGDGGGIYATGAISISHSVIRGNRAGDGGGSTHAGYDAGAGGGLYLTAETSVTASVIQSNTAGSGNDNSYLTPGGAGGSGGGIYNSGNLHISESTLSQNHAGSGSSSGTVGGEGGSGGGIYNIGTLELSQSAVNANVASSGGYGSTKGADGSGGGIANDGTATIINSTVTANSAPAGGGGISNGNALELVNVTLVKNSASSGGNLSTQNLSAIAKNSVIADSAGGGNCSGSLNDGGGNLRWQAKDSSCVGRIATPRLNALAYNGGLTLTMLPQDASAALRLGVKANCPAVDQRGIPRVQTASCDAGAVELGLECSAAPAAPALKSPPNDAALDTARATLKWSARTCADTYRVLVKNTATGKVADKKNGLFVTKFKTASLPSNATYKWFVKACNAHGCAKSLTRQFTLH